MPKEPDPKQTDQNPDPNNPDPKEPEKKEPDTKTYSAEEYKIIASEKKAEKEKTKTLQVELDKLKAEKQKLTDDELKKKGDYQTIIDAKETEINELKTKAERVDALETQLQEIETSTKKELLANMTKEQQEYAKDKSVTDIRAFAKLIGTSNSPIEVDSSGNLVSKSDVKATDAQKKEADIKGLPVEDYLWLEEQRKQRQLNKIKK